MMLAGMRGPAAKPQLVPPQPRSFMNRQLRRPVRCMGLKTDGTSEAQSVQRLMSSMMDYHLQDAAAAGSSDCTSTQQLLDSEQLLDCIYEGLDEEIFYSNGGFKIPKREKQSIDATGGSSSYGEVQAAGLDTLIRYLAMDSSSTFVDLGCGRGRAVLQVALHAPVVKAIGLELSDSRLEQAEMALEQLQGRLQQQGRQLRPVEFRRADLSSCSFEEGSHFYLCSTAFGAAICRSIAERLQASPSFKALMTSRQLPSQPHLTKLGEVPCEYSFNSDGRAYIYVKSLSPAVAPAAVLSRLWCRNGVCWLPGMAIQQLALSPDEPVAAAAGRRFVHLSGQQERATAGSSAGASRDNDTNSTAQQ